MEAATFNRFSTAPAVGKVGIFLSLAEQFARRKANGCLTHTMARLTSGANPLS